jgi:broad specificity phosphatase PhoE
MGTRIYLIRHGATPHSAENRFAGESQVPLSDEGCEQVERLALRLSHMPIAGIYTSPLERTVDTARIVAEPHGLEVQTMDALREINHGHWEGLTRQEPASLTILDFKDMMRARLTLYNDTSHYSEAGMAIPDMPKNRLSSWWDSPKENRHEH